MGYETKVYHNNLNRKNHKGKALLGCHDYGNGIYGTNS
jgi:hypothetical protein